MLQKINRGDVYFYDFGYNYDGSIEGKIRPCVIVSNDKGNNFGTTALVAPITTRTKESCKPWQVHFQNGDKSQVILCEQIRVVNISKLRDYQGRLDILTMRAVDEALAIELNLNIAQKEHDSTEFLHRLDVALDRIINKRLNNRENKVTDKTGDSSEYKEIISGILEIKNLFNKNSNNLDTILTTLINLYKDMNVQSLGSKIKNDETESHTHENRKVNKRTKYTVEYAKTLVTDYYDLDKNAFMTKYDLKDKIAVNNKLTTMRAILKRNGIDYKNIKNHITIYNINDLSEEEKQTNFSKYLKNNKTLSVVKTFEEVKKTIMDERESQKLEKSKTSARNANWQPKINYEDIDGLLEFLKECNENSVSYICDKYGLTQKQLSNRKYLISKSLKERNIPFTMIKKSRKDV